jgi:hypothetical protein
MKRIITLFVLLTTTFLYSQSSGITYQAVLYNPSGEILPGNNNANAVLSNKDICLRFSITDVQTSLEYQETQKVKTDEFGMVNLLVGSGSQVGGYATNFSAIVWNSSSKKLQVEIDVTGTCANFIEVSKQDFSAVPFAYASKTAENVTGIVPITNGGTGSNTVSGAKTNLGLNNVDNTSDLNKPISLATQTALNGKENTANKSTNTSLGTSDVLFPTQNAVKTYVDNQLSSGVVDATTSIKGKIKLAGDLGGTADMPTVPGLVTKENTANKSTNTALGTSDVLFPTQNAVKTYIDNQVSSGVVDAGTSVKGKIQLGGDLAGTNSSAVNPIISNAAISTLKIADNAVTNTKIGGVISVNKGGTGSDMSNTSGYLKQTTTGSNFTSVSSIPVEDVTGAVRSVNGVFPATNGNVSVIIGQVTTGTNSDPTQVVATPHNSDIYVVSGQIGTPNDNGRTFISDGVSWHEIATNIASLENTFVKLSGSTMFGNLVFPTGKKITIADAPIGSTDVVNKNYVDTKIGGSGTANFLSKFTSSTQLDNSSLFDNGTNVGVGTITPSSKFEVVGDLKSRNGANTNSILLNTSLSSLDITSSSRMFRFGSFTGTTYNSLIDGTVYVAGLSGISQLSMNTPGNQPITFATNDWLERMRIQPTTGNVGIGTNNPTSKLEINGAATNSTALNSLASTTIDFSKSNLAYTTASAGAFILTNIKDGGTFTLAVQGANSGISTFTCTGFTFKYVNNGITSPNKHTLYTFLVMGTTVYVYMATGF